MMPRFDMAREGQRVTCRVVEVAALASALLLGFGCGAAPVLPSRDLADANDTGTTLEPRSEEERALLRELPQLPTGQTRRVRGASVVVGAPYEAASGRRCRALHIQAETATQSHDRLACTEGKSWFFVPNVFGTTGD